MLVCQTLANHIDLLLNSLQVLRVNPEYPVLRAQEQNGLEYQLEPFALPILKCGGPELRPALFPDDRLHCQCLAKPGAKKE